MTHPGFNLTAYAPGACAKVNGRWLALAGGYFDSAHFVVRSDSFLLTEEIASAEAPVGPGFKDPYDTEPVLCLAGGTGMGAMTHLVTQRAGLGLKTLVQFFCRGAKKDDVLRAFPVLEQVDADFGCWDTEFWGRPTPDELAPGWSGAIFFAGPKGMLESLRGVNGPPRDVRLNF